MDKKKERSSHVFNDGVWFAIQELVIDWEQPTIAKDIAKKAGILLEEAYYLQKKSGFLDEIMNNFIKKNLE